MAKEFQTTRIVATNISNGPRGINGVTSTVMVGRGETSKEIEVSEGELASMQNSANFSVKVVGQGRTVRRNEANARPSRITDQGKRLAELEVRVVALEDKAGIVRQSADPALQPQATKPTEPTKVESVNPEDIGKIIAMADDRNISFPEFKSAAAKVLGDKTPDKKVDIISALQDLQPKA